MRSVVFGGWQGPDTSYVLARSGYHFDGDPHAPDRGMGVIASCTLPAGTCTPVREVRATETLVFANGTYPEGG